MALILDNIWHVSFFLCSCVVVRKFTHPTLLGDGYQLFSYISFQYIFTYISYLVRLLSKDAKHYCCLIGNSRYNLILMGLIAETLYWFYQIFRQINPIFWWDPIPILVIVAFVCWDYHISPYCRIYASMNKVSIGSDNGLLPIRREAII